MFDSHCHLDFDGFDEPVSKIIKAARQAGVSRFIVPAVGKNNWHKIHRLSLEYDSIFPAYGIHPWLSDFKQTDLDELAVWLERHSAVAIGECGLDFLPKKPEKKLQEKVFNFQIELGQRHELPLIIHSTKAVDRACQILKTQPGLNGVFHGLSSSIEQVRKILDMGFYFGIGCLLLNPKATKVRALAKFAPLDRILLETDSPEQQFAACKQNTPANIPLIAHELAIIKGLEYTEVFKQCNMNVKNCFGI